MAQIDTNAPKRLRVRSAYDPRWMIALLVGVALSVAYYGTLFWATVLLVRWLLSG